MAKKTIKTTKVPKGNKKKQVDSKKEKTKKALKLVKEINDYIEKNFVNKEITSPPPMKSTELKPFRK